MKKEALLNRKVLWGASTSAYQVEGAYNQDGKGPSIMDVREVPEGTTDYKVAADHYNRFEEDVALFKEMGLESYRFSISWTRIFPKGNGEINPKGVAFYHRLLKALIAADITPIVTVYHFDLPYALYEKGGWSSRETLDAFYDYCVFLFKEYGDDVKYWLTINEQNMVTHASRVLFGQSKTLKVVYQENHHMLVAQAKVMKHYHEAGYDGVIGPAPNINAVYPASKKPEDQLAAGYFSAFRNWLYLDAAVFGTYNHQAMTILRAMDAEPTITDEDRVIMKTGKADFIAINYYGTTTAQAYPLGEGMKHGDQQSGWAVPGFFEGVLNDELKKTAYGWDVDELGFKITLHEVYSRYQLPIMITENGLGAPDTLTEDKKVHDDYRIDYLQKHVDQVRDAVKEGVSIISYCPWSALDLISTHQGIEKRYGFIYVNRGEFDLRDLNRYRKDSFYWYQNFIQSQKR